MQRPIQGESIPSPSPKPDLDAMKAASVAINSNEKIFPVFAQKLASGDLSEYVHTAHKLAIWLSSEKAYYPVARPKIVKLIETAHSTFINVFIHLPAAAEAAERLRKLIDAIARFRHLFPENELQSRLHRVLSDANMSISVATSGTIHANVNPHGSANANVHPPPTLPSLPAAISQIQTSSTVQAVSDGSVHADTPQVASPLEATPLAQVKAALSLVPPITTIPQDLESVSPTAASKPQPKRARRAELSEELIARDLDWFKSQQGSAVVKDEPSASTSSFNPEQFSPTLLSETSPVPQQSPSPRKKTARMVSSRRLPRRVLFNGTQEAESSGSASAPLSEPPADKAASLESPEDSSVQMDVDEQHSSPDLDARSANIPEHPSAPAPLPEAILDSTEQVDASCSNLDSASPVSEQPSKVVSSPLQFSQEFQLRDLVLPPLVSAFDPPLNLDFAVSQIPQLPETSRFNGQMAVIHSMQGKPFTHTHIIDINFNEGMYSKISKWMNRKSHPSEAPEGVCISLACYCLPELFKVVKSESGKLDVQELMLRSSCSWPLNRLSLHVDNDGRVTTIPLSPPYFLTRDGCVDVTSLMKPGTNTLHMRQEGDASEYLVVLHAHLPTKAQLAEVEAVKVADERWRQLLDVLSARVVPKMCAASESAVGVF